MMGSLTPRAQRVIDVMVEESLNDEDLTEILFELLYDIAFDDNIQRAFEKRGYEIRPIMEIPD